MTKALRLPMDRGPEISINVDGVGVICHQGETVATALLTIGVGAFRRGVNDLPRIPFCNMGTCLECTVTIDGRPLQRSCIIEAREGMMVQTGSK